MPEPQSNPGYGGTFPLPNALVDDWMPKLKDTEMRLLLVVLRQTAGRREVNTGRGKERDWLTQSQLKRRTGRASEAISAAIDALVRQGLLSVEAENAEPLETPEQRRRHLSKLYFRPGKALISKQQGKSEHVKPNITKNNGYEMNKLRRIRIIVSESSSRDVDTKNAPQEQLCQQDQNILETKRAIRERLKRL